MGLCVEVVIVVAGLLPQLLYSLLAGTWPHGYLCCCWPALRDGAIWVPAMGCRVAGQLLGLLPWQAMRATPLPPSGILALSTLWKLRVGSTTFSSLRLSSGRLLRYCSGTLTSVASFRALLRYSSQLWVLLGVSASVAPRQVVKCTRYSLFVIGFLQRSHCLVRASHALRWPAYSPTGTLSSQYSQYLVLAEQFCVCLLRSAAGNQALQYWQGCFLWNSSSCYSWQLMSYISWHWGQGLMLRRQYPK